MGDNLKEKMIGALTWSAVDRIAQQGVQFVVGIILARLLTPDDYGLLGIVMVFAAIAYTMVEGGLQSAIVRTHKLEKKHCDTVFYTNLAISLLLYMLLYFSAPLIADFYKEPEITPVARVIFLAVIFNSFYLVPYALFGRDMDYKSQTKVNFTSTLASGIAGVAMAFAGCGIWALVTQQLGYHFVRMIMFYVVSKWRPGLNFSWTVLKEYWSFSIHLLSNNIIGVLFNNLYTFLIGKLYPIKQVGFYTQAYKLSDTVNFTFNAILSTTYNMFAQIHDQPDRVSRILGEISKRIAVVAIPLLGFLIVSAEPLFQVLFGDKWLPAVPYFQLLCAANLFNASHRVNVHALNALGESKITFNIELVKRILILVSVALTFRYGINELLAGFAIACYGGFFASMLYVKRHLKIKYLAQFSFLYKGILIAVICCMAVTGIDLLVPEEEYFLRLLVQTVSCAGIYIGLVRLLCKDIFFRTLDWAKTAVRKHLQK